MQAPGGIWSFDIRTDVCYDGLITSSDHDTRRFSTTAGLVNEGQDLGHVVVIQVSKKSSSLQQSVISPSAPIPGPGIWDKVVLSHQPSTAGPAPVHFAYMGG